ncbi:hypothetical protein BDR22DRAFT_968954 [Usnea florida]
MKGWDCAENVELKKWIDTFKYTEVVTDSEKLASDLFPRRDSAFRTENIIDLLHYARMYIRNTAAHRQPVSEEQLVDRVHAAIRTAILLSDWPRAIEIEIASEMWITGTSRHGVLERLSQNSQINFPTLANVITARRAFQNFHLKASKTNGRSEQLP